MHPNQTTANASPGPADPQHPPLQRGKACLSCRRRKMKCDGARPVCTPCLRGERVEDCEYTDGRQRPRTLTLEEDIARLRARVWELENPDEVMPSVELHIPYSGIANTSAVTLARSGQAQAQVPSGSYHHHAVGTPSRSGSLSAIGETTESYLRAETEFEVTIGAQVDLQHAVSAIAPYATELGFFLDLDRLRVQGTQILPALQKALTLWAVTMTAAAEPGHERTREGVDRIASITYKLLGETQAQLATALCTVDAELDPAIVMHVIQTGILLAYFMQRIGQIVGARYYASGTWALGTMLKLHQNPHLHLLSSLHSSGGQGQLEALPPGSSGGAASSSSPSLLRKGSPLARDDGARCTDQILSFAFAGGSATLPPPLDGIEAEERVRAFWALYALDRWFAAVGQGPRQSLVTNAMMTIPWPASPSTRHMTAGRSDVIAELLSDPTHDFTRDEPATMHAKASILLGETNAIVESFAADNSICQMSGFWARFTTLDALLERCLNAAMATSAGALPSSSSLHGGGQHLVLVTVHIAALALAILHRPFVSTYRSSRRRSIEGAMGTVRLLDRLGGAFGTRAGICPTYPIVWTVFCVVLHEEVQRLRAGSVEGDPSSSPQLRRSEAEMIAAIRKLGSMLSVLSQHCPSKFFASKIEAVLPILESVSV